MSGCTKEASRRDVVFMRELKVGIFKLKDLQRTEVGTKLDRPHEKDGRSFLVTRVFIDPFVT